MSGNLPESLVSSLQSKLSRPLLGLLMLPPREAERALRRMSTRGARRLLTDWRFWARQDQLWVPGPERTTFACTGRGWGKTRWGAETTHKVARDWPEMCAGRMVLIGRTAADVRDVMIQGESGILNTGDPEFRPKYEPSKRLLTWPNGCTAVLRSGEEPAQIRGLNVGWAWLDEYAFWAYPQMCWDNLQFALRIGENPKVIVSSTPLPTEPVRRLYNDPTTRVITGNTLDNRINLARDSVADMRRRYDGTKLGDQEMGGLILDGNESALWEMSRIRRIEFYDLPELINVCVGVDPAGGDKADNTRVKHVDTQVSDETGIVAAGVDARGNLYALGDSSGRMSSNLWAKEAVKLALRWEARTIVGETNFGGDMVRSVIMNEPTFHEAGLKFEMVHAKEGKGKRAEPVAMLYEQSRGFHVGNPAQFVHLEHQMTTFDPNLPRQTQKSPDRMDAFVHAARHLIGAEGLDTGSKSGRSSRATWREIGRRLREGSRRR